MEKKTSCPACGKLSVEDFIYCPYCAQELFQEKKLESIIRLEENESDVAGRIGGLGERLELLENRLHQFMAANGKLS